jgi:hypothetical protein
LTDLPRAVILEPSTEEDDMPDPINTETEFMGIVPMPNTVGDLGPDTRKLSSAERKRLGLLTGQEEDPYAVRQPGFMGGVDTNFPDPALAKWHLDDPDIDGREYVE